MKTPLQQLIEWIEDSISNERIVLSNPKDYHPNDVSQARNIVSAANFAIRKATELLQEERDMVINAHSHGIRFMAENTIIPQPESEHYFNQTYTSQSINNIQL